MKSHFIQLQEGPLMINVIYFCNKNQIRWYSDAHHIWNKMMDSVMYIYWVYNNWRSKRSIQSHTNHNITSTLNSYILSQVWNVAKQLLDG